MNAFGIIAEYNPFHYGHEYLINKIKADYPGSVVVAVMSGDFVQRGEAAVFDKYTRARAACLSGADLVIELPVRWSIAGAESFAKGAVSLLAGIGIKSICFGSECGDIKPLENAARAVVSEDFGTAVTQLMKNTKTLSYAAARSIILAERLGVEAEFFKQPNNILGIEYIKAAHSTGKDVSFITYKRTGNAHDKKGDSDILSASDIRARFNKGERIEAYVPQNAALEYIAAVNKGCFLSAEKYRNALLTMLSLQSSRELSKGAYCGSEISNSIYNSMTCSKSFDELIDNACSKTYTKAHIRRAVLSGILRIEKNESAVPGFARILAANQKGREYIKNVKESAEIPFISKTADIKKLSPNSVEIFEENARAHDFYKLVCVKGEYSFHGDWKTGPAML